MRKLLPRILLLLAVAMAAAIAWRGCAVRRPVTEGKYDLRTNGIWLQHGWLGDDGWFLRNRRDRSRFRNDARIRELSLLLAGHGVRDVFPHLCPCSPDGRIAPADSLQTERFLDGFSAFRVLPWVGGVSLKHCFTDSAAWRGTFVSSVAELLARHPRLAGIHLNIEPVPDGNEAFLLLLDELRRAMPERTIISVAAYPPPKGSRTFSNVHWQQPYYAEVARRTDQIVPMMYDTSVRSARFYRHVMRVWSRQVLEWSGTTPVLFGVPAYEDPGAGYHIVEAENLRNALSGIHAGLDAYRAPPGNYAGVAIYCEWEMDGSEWASFRRAFGKKPERVSFPLPAPED